MHGSLWASHKTIYGYPLGGEDMKVLSEKEYAVKIRNDNSKKRTACGWAYRCPTTCSKCPAYNGATPRTRAEAVEFWEKAKVKK